MVWGTRMRRTVADTRRWLAVVTPEGKKQKKITEKKRLHWRNRWINKNWVVKKRKIAETLQKARRQNCLIIDAYNSGRKLKIDDKCREADDVIHCIHYSDLNTLDVDCCFITSQTVLFLLNSRPKWCHVTLLTLHFQTMTVQYLHLSSGQGHVHNKNTNVCDLSWRRTGKQLYSCHVSELTAWCFSCKDGLPALHIPTGSVIHFHIHMFLIKY